MIANQIVGIGSVQATAFTPASISGLKAWYDASDTATISLSGSEVTQWNDKSGNTVNVTQGTSARRPSSGINTQNGLNVLTFGGDDLLQAASASYWTFMSNSTGCTIFWAGYFNTSASYNTLACTASSSADSGIYFAKDATDNLYTEVYRGTGGTFVSNLDAGTLADNSANYASMVVDNANATAANRLIYKINGGSNLTGNTSTLSASANTPANPLYIGSYSTSGLDGLNGRLFEMIIYTGILSSGDIALVNSYLDTKWGL